MSLVVEGQTYKWEGGTLEELLSLLAEAALTVRVETLHADHDEKLGEIHVVAGGVSETIAGDRRGDAAMAYLRQIPGLRFLAHPTLPDPEDGALGAPGSLEGSLAQRPPPALMRYCENFVLTCALELRHGDDHVRISYRRGEILRTLVNGSESGERLPEVMSWTDGTWRISLPQLALPRPTKASRPLRAPTLDSSTIFGYQVQPPASAGGSAPAPTAPAGGPQVTAPYAHSPALPGTARLRRLSDGATPMVETGSRAPLVAVDARPEVKPDLTPEIKPEARLDTRPEPRVEARPEAPFETPSMRADTRPEIRSSDHKRADRPERRSAERPLERLLEQLADDSETDPQRALTPTMPPPAAAPAPAGRQRGAGSFLASLLLHALLGVALGLAIVGGYWAFLRWGGALRLG